MNKPKKAPENVKNASLHIQKSRKKKKEKRKKLRLAQSNLFDQVI